MEEKALSGKVALVAGGSRGIGAGIVRRLARDGASVVFTYASSQTRAEQLVQEVATSGGTVKAFQADSSSSQSIYDAVAFTVKEFGSLDVYVNNAGVLLHGSIGEFSLDALDKMIAVNIRAAVVGIQAASRSMNEGGRIITIGSAAAIRTGFPGSSIYSMTKSALTGLVRGAAIDLASRNITVNNIQPGPIATDMNPADGPHVEMLTKLIPLRRFGTDKEVASLVAYLATAEAGFITGVSLTVDGGYVA